MDQIFAQISSSATTWNSVWKEWANWSNRYRDSGLVNFSALANPSGFHFYVKAEFSNATFLSGPNLSDAVFHESAFFRYADFKLQPNFRGVIFRDTADFYGASFTHGPVDFSRAKFMGQFSISVYSHERDDKLIPEIHFEGCEFHEKADFSNRVFVDVTDFRLVKFRGFPVFHGTLLHQGIDFGDIDKSFTDFDSDGAEQRYRTLKRAMSDQQARAEEAAFAALELKSRRHRLNKEAKNRPIWKRLLPWISFLPWADRCGYWLWEKCSKSGRSFFRPFGLYVASLIGFAALYVWFPTCKMIPPFYVWSSIGRTNSLYLFYALFLQIQDWWLQGRDWWLCLRYSFLKQFPFAAAFRGGPNRVSELEKKLFETNLPPGWVDLLNSAQSITALVLIFLMGLGIRHKFRLR
ncbi:MAG: pentapeptide repeat-containing protein [Deltaproteobacteria bacterium]|nr:pentapeptide repeat-containing protein [Deltaproteobacteria bacterium]